MNSLERNRYKCIVGSRYDRLSDKRVVEMAQTGDGGALEHLLYKYRGLVRTKTRSYFLMGAEKDDLLQVGMIGLWQSIVDYSAAKDISFLSFARICIERHVITAIKTATRQKQSPLNNAISIEHCTEENESDFNLSEVLISEVDLDPEELLLKRENTRRLRTTLKTLLSPFEWEVLKRYNLGKTYNEIAVDMECNTKSVDNALGRIKRKLSSTSDELIS